MLYNPYLNATLFKAPFTCYSIKPDTVNKC